MWEGCHCAQGCWLWPKTADVPDWELFDDHLLTGPGALRKNKDGGQEKQKLLIF